MFIIQNLKATDYLCTSSVCRIDSNGIGIWMLLRNFMSCLDFGSLKDRNSTDRLGLRRRRGDHQPNSHNVRDKMRDKTYECAL
jgi:hypothetical protein